MQSNLPAAASSTPVGVGAATFTVGASSICTGSPSGEFALPPAADSVSESSTVGADSDSSDHGGHVVHIGAYVDVASHGFTLTRPTVGLDYPVCPHVGLLPRMTWATNIEAMEGHIAGANTPPFSVFVRRASTAPSSPRVSIILQNSGHARRVRPYPTTLNIPGMTRSLASPDGRIAARDVASKLVIIMVGLPARGKSYITKKIARYISWQQHDCKIFNLGTKRRENAAAQSPALELQSPPAELSNSIPRLSLNDSSSANAVPSFIVHNAEFFNPQNVDAANFRDQLALDTLTELLDYVLSPHGAVGILDATNSTINRRTMLVNHIRLRNSKIGILFVESVCDNKELLEANMRLKLSGPDYKDKDPVSCLDDFKQRVAAYESAYEPLGKHEEQCRLQFIKMIDVNRMIVSHKLTGFLSVDILAYLSIFNLSPRQIWITRHGQSEDNVRGRIGGDSELTQAGHAYATALHRFITIKRGEWNAEQKHKLDNSTFPPSPGDSTPPYPEVEESDLQKKNFCVWTSALRRSVDTAERFLKDPDYDVKNWTPLNELNAGQFEGMTYEDIARRFPVEFRKREADKKHYVYPGMGGESYLAVINRMQFMVREIERITDHVLIIAHRAVCRVLMAYFMDLDKDIITKLEVSLGMLYSIEPKPYGIEFHAYKYDAATGSFLELVNFKPGRPVDRER